LGFNGGFNGILMVVYIMGKWDFNGILMDFNGILMGFNGILMGFNGGLMGFNCV